MALYAMASQVLGPEHALPLLLAHCRCMLSSSVKNAPEEPAMLGALGVDLAGDMGGLFLGQVRKPFLRTADTTSRAY